MALEHPVLLRWTKLAPETESVAILTLNRPRSCNAFDASMVDQLCDCLSQIERTRGCRALVLTGAGKHFCSGADLAWMKKAAEFTSEENVSDARRFLRLFEQLYRISLPTLAVVRGAACAGAIGLVACCDIVIADKSSQFCLSESRLGLLPAVVMPYICRRIATGQLFRHGLTGRPFSSDEALRWGLVDLVTEPSNLEACLQSELSAILAAGPVAQKAFKSLHRRILDEGMQQGDYTVEAIAKARASSEGQAGMKAFFEKTAPPWSAELPKNTSLLD